MKSKISSLSKSEDFKNLLNGKKISNPYSTIFFKKLSSKNNKLLNVSIVTKRKIGNAVKRNRIKRKLKSVVQKLLKINSAINSDYTYIIFGKSKVYNEHSGALLKKMQKSFKEIRS